MALVISAVTSIEKANELKLASHTIITTSGSKDLRVMSNHCPAGEGERRQGQDRDDVHTKSHGEHTYYSTGITPHDHLIKMLYISRALILLQLVAELFHISREGIEIEVLDPFVTLCELDLGGLLRATHSGMRRVAIFGCKDEVYPPMLLQKHEFEVSWQASLML